MNASNFDAIVVGAGTAGCICAKELAKRKMRVLVVEEDAAAGKHGKCTSIFSKKGLDSLGVDYSPALLNEIKGAHIRAENTELKMRAKEVQALVLDRFALDAQFALEAKQAGAKFAFAQKAVSIKKLEDGWFEVICQSAVSARKTRFVSRFLVGADGVGSTVARELNFPEISAKDFVLCWEGEYAPAFTRDAEMADLFLDAELFKGFFGWIVPCSSRCARVGFGTSNHAVLDWAKKKFLETNADVEFALGHGRATKKREFVAMIPVRVRPKTQDGYAVLVGDAAGQVKATTGGGVVFGGLCAKIAAEEISRVAKEGGKLDYERAWRAKYGNTLAIHRIIRTAYNAMPNWLISLALRAASALGVGKFLEARGDMDWIVKA